jgi:hypothetical protein
MARDNVTFKFRIDLTQMTIKGKQAIKILEDIEMKSGKAAAGMSRMGTASAKSGQQTAAAAINFQTATQGMLNLSTAAVQTYTSISNLDRANNRAKMSVIAVARAEDLLANKLERQNTLRASGLAGSQKDINITKEIATAKADLTVKTEKMGIEQSAVNDIYMLFASNIANVTISSMQTIAILDKNSVILNGAKAVGMKLNNFLSINAARAAYSQAAAEAVNSTSKAVATGVTGTLTVAMYGLAAATRAVVAANPLLLIAMAGLTVAWAVHESDILGSKTALDGYLGVEKDHLEIMEAERLAANGLTEANQGLANSYKKLSTPMENYLKIQEVIAIQNNDLAAQIRITQQRMGFSPSVGSSSVGGTGTVSGGSVVVPGRISSGGGGYSGGSYTSASNSQPATVGAANRGGVIPSSYADNSIPEAVENTNPQSTIADPLGSFIEKANFGAMNAQDQALQLISLSNKAMDSGEDFKASSYGKWLGAISDDAVNYVKPEAGKHITFADIQKSSSGLGGTGTRTVNELLEGSSPWIATGVGKFKLGTDYSNVGTRTFYSGFGGKLLADSAAAGMKNFGQDSLMVKYLSKLQAEGLDFTKTNTNLKRQTQFDFDYMNKYGGVNGGLNVSSGGGFTQSAIAAGASVSQTRGSTRWDARNAQTLANNRRSNAIKDSNTNRLNLMGATRVEGIPMDQEGAVVGGYSSRREFDQAMKHRAAVADRANVQLGAFFGVGINYSAIYGRSSARAQQSRLNSTVEGIRSTLASAGLGYKTTNARYRRGQGPEQYAAVMAEWSNVRSYNANQLSKAREINTLQQFGQSQFFGSGLSLPSLQDAIARQDEKVTTIGLNRTEAFQIIGSTGRGVDEIDARVLWKNRVNNISTGTSVL